MELQAGNVTVQEVQPLRWTGTTLELLDQTRLPMEYAVVEVCDYRQAAQAIREMRVRGAPAIGVAGAYGVALAALEIQEDQLESFRRNLEQAAAVVVAARPTAVNLKWAVDRMLRVARQEASVQATREALVAEAERIHEEDVAANRALGQQGAELIPQGGGVLTHCNAGALATAGYGTALGIVRAAWEQGKRFRVVVTETRPFLQGARLTTWELVHLGIPTTLIVDSAAASFMGRQEVQCVVVGADRIAANGDVANKIGTYGLAVLAKEHGIPFYVAVPTSTIDLSLSTGEAIPIEEREHREVTHWGEAQTAPEGVQVRNPAFDVTPARYVTAIVTECGIVWHPYEVGLKRVKDG